VKDFFQGHVYVKDNDKTLMERFLRDVIIPDLLVQLIKSKLKCNRQTALIHLSQPTKDRAKYMWVSDMLTTRDILRISQMEARN
jgi:hypothetical protein